MRAPLALGLLLVASCSAGAAGARPPMATKSTSAAAPASTDAATTVAVTDPAVDRPTLVVLGDSLSRPVGNAALADRDWMRWADPEHRFELIANASIAGQRSDQILARVRRDVIARDPEWATVLAGTNDVGADVGAMTIIANLISIYDQLDAAGIRFVAFTLPPALLLDPDRVATLEAVNEWLREHVETDWPGAILADWGAALSVDGDTITPRPGWFPDGVHFNANGAEAAGRAVEPIFAAIPLG